MHIEPGVVAGAKIGLGFLAGAAALSYAMKEAYDFVKNEGLLALAERTAAAGAAVLCLFEIAPHTAVGVSEVHLILGSTLFLLLGAAPAALGLALGLLAQGVLFEPQDLPQYGMNVATLLVPLFGLSALASRIIAPNVAYVDLSYRQTFALSAAYQGGVVAWVAFWVLWGQGMSLPTLANIASFGAAYLAILLIEPALDIGLLALAKTIRTLKNTRLLSRRLFAAA